MPLARPSLLTLIALTSCDAESRFSRLPAEGAFRELVVETYGPAAVPFTFRNDTPDTIKPPFVKVSCGCLGHAFDKKLVEPGASLVLTVSFAVHRRGVASHRILLTWADGRTTDLALVLRGKRLRGIELSANAISAEEWRRSGMLRIGFFADFLPDRMSPDAKIEANIEANIVVRLDGSQIERSLLNVEHPGPGTVSGEIVISRAPPPQVRELEVEIPGLPPAVVPISAEVQK